MATTQIQLKIRIYSHVCITCILYGKMINIAHNKGCVCKCFFFRNFINCLEVFCSYKQLIQLTALAEEFHSQLESKLCYGLFQTTQCKCLLKMHWIMDSRRQSSCFMLPLRLKSGVRNFMHRNHMEKKKSTCKPLSKLLQLFLETKNNMSRSW